MEGWQIGLMVVICVVFVLGVMALTFLIWRFWNWRKKKSCQGSSEASKKYRTHGAKPSTHVLHYIDFNHTLHSIDFNLCPELITGAGLQEVVARDCALANPTTISLSYLNDEDVLVEMDLDRLIARDADFGKRMYHTGERPLMMSRLIEISMPNSSAGAVVSAAGPASSQSNPFANYYSAHHGNQIDIDMNLQRQMASMTGGEGGAQENARAMVPAAAALYADPSSAQGFLPNSNNTSAFTVPTPIIFPSSTHITTSTPICVMAASYYVLEPPAATGASTGTRYTLLDVKTAALLEAAMCGETESRTVQVREGPYRGSTFTVDPDRGTALLQVSGLGNYDVVRRQADVVRCNIDRSNSTQWQPFERPFCLPPGRWCVRAKASTFDDRQSETSAKVYTVSIV